MYSIKINPLRFQFLQEILRIKNVSRGDVLTDLFPNLVCHLSIEGDVFLLYLRSIVYKGSPCYHWCVVYFSPGNDEDYCLLHNDVNTFLKD